MSLWGMLSRYLPVIACWLLGAATAWANDASLYYSGAPRMLRGHPTVSMRSEVVRMTIDDQQLSVDCTFVFENQGKACAVRMGFPEWQIGTDPPFGTRFESFRSYVDGRPVKTRVVAASNDKFWHTKIVRFPARSRRVIRDVYTMAVGGHLAGSPTGTPWVDNACYILHTGASWRGPIGRTEVLVTFKRQGMTAPLRPVRVPGGTPLIEPSKQGWSYGPNAVFYSGPCRPVVRGRTLRFVRRNWDPTSADDILLAFFRAK